MSKDDTEDITKNINENKIQSISKTVSGVLTIVGIIVAFLMIAIMGISFMVQSTEEKARIKEALIPFLIGAIVTFGAFGIWRVVLGMLAGIE